MHTFGILVNVLVLWWLALWACFSLLGWLARKPRLVGRRRRPRGLPSLAASPMPNLATTFTTRRTQALAASSSSSTARGRVPVDTATQLALAARSRNGGRISYGAVTAARGANGAPRGDAAFPDDRPFPSWSS